MVKELQHAMKTGLSANQVKDGANINFEKGEGPRYSGVVTFKGS